MALRSFTTTDGSRCDVWEVPASYVDRRVRERRGQDVLAYRGPERRRTERRRGLPRAAVVAPDYSRGWLAFDSGGEKRRLAPPPPGWEALPEERLAELWERSRPVPLRPRTAR